MIRTILFPTDFTESAEQAGRWAQQLATQSGARLLVLHVVAPVLLPGTEDDEDLKDFSRDLEQKAQHSVDAAVQAFRAAGVDAQGKVLVGSSFEEIENYAKATEASLIVMGSHGLGADPDTPIGTLSHKLFFLSKVPILFVR